ncbi:unnamed protein product, partial [Polarella glacialis]
EESEPLPHPLLHLDAGPSADAPGRRLLQEAGGVGRRRERPSSPTTPSRRDGRSRRQVLPKPGPLRASNGCNLHHQSLSLAKLTYGLTVG